MAHKNFYKLSIIIGVIIIYFTAAFKFKSETEVFTYVSKEMADVKLQIEYKTNKGFRITHLVSQNVGSGKGDILLVMQKH